MSSGNRIPLLKSHRDVAITANPIVFAPIVFTLHHMSDADGDPAVALPLPPLTPIIPRSTRDLAIETAIVLMICVVPGLFISMASIYLLPERRSSSDLYLYQSIYDVVRDSGRLGLILYLISRSAEPLARFGIKRFRILYDLLGGAAIFSLVKLAQFLVWNAIGFLQQHNLIGTLRHYQSGFSPPSGPGAYEILFFRCLLIGLAEESVFRAYLIPRFEKLFESTGLALLFSTVLFGGIHMYQGAHGVLSATLHGLIYGSLFCLFRRLWPLALAHAIWDFMSFAAMR